MQGYNTLISSGCIAVDIKAMQGVSMHPCHQPEQTDGALGHTNIHPILGLLCREVLRPFMLLSPGLGIPLGVF